MTVQYDTPDSPLAAVVARRMHEPVAPDLITVRWGYSSAQMRQVGGHIVSAYARDSNTSTTPQELLYPGQSVSEAQLRQPKLRASHVGVPAGDDGLGVGNKHGAARYARYNIVSCVGNSYLLQAELGRVGIGIYREIILSEGQVIVRDSVENTRPYDGGDEATSVLSHLYLRRGAVQPTAERPVTINGNTLDDILQEDGAAQKIIQGQSYFWRQFADKPSAVIGMPDGSEIGVIAESEQASVSGALLWAPPGENAFCLEPVVGRTPESNRGCLIVPGGIGTLAVTIVARGGGL